MKNPSVTFVICVHNNREVIGSCLRAIRQQESPAEECLVVDDASTDGTSAWIREHHPWVRLMRSTTNVGPARCRNLAIAEVRTKYIAFLDSDVELDRRWLTITLDALRGDSEAGIVGGKLLYASQRQRVNAYGGAMSRIGIAWNAHEGEPADRITESRECLWTSSAAMLVRREVLERIGGFDERFFYGHEDSDLGWRTNIAGWRCLCVPGATAYHRVSHTILMMEDRPVFHHSKNRLRSLLKNYGPARLTAFVPLYLVLSLADLLLRAPRVPKLKAWAWSMAALGDTLRHRRRVQATRAVSDAGLARLFSRRLVARTRLHRRRAASPH